MAAAPPVSYTPVGYYVSLLSIPEVTKGGGESGVLLPHPLALAIGDQFSPQNRNGLPA